MQPSSPEPSPFGGAHLGEIPDGHAGADGVDVGSFEQGSPASRWALARYVVGRVILERVSWSLLGLALVALVLAGVSQIWLHTSVLTVLLVIVAVVVLLMRALLLAVLRRLMSFGAGRNLEDRLDSIVGAARGDVLAELRRVGLPSHTVTLPLIAVRLATKRRTETTAKLRRFDIERAVSKTSLDEVHMLLRDAAGTSGYPGSGA